MAEMCWRASAGGTPDLELPIHLLVVGGWSQFKLKKHKGEGGDSNFKFILLK